MQDASPFIVTLLLDDSSASFFNGLRQKHFPTAINHIKAHLSLFHHLPSTEQKIKEDLQRWSQQTKAFGLNVMAVTSIGKGVAYKIESTELMQLHKAMQQAWQQWLSPQDKQKLWPHITVQNKVSPMVVKETLQELQKDFQPFTAQALGFTVWYYEGGPWRFADEHRFSE